MKVKHFSFSNVLCVPKQNAGFTLLFLRNRCRFLAHMSLTVSYKAMYNNISKENLQIYIYRNSCDFCSYQFDICMSFKNNIWTHELYRAPLLHNSLLSKTARLEQY